MDSLTGTEISAAISDDATMLIMKNAELDEERNFDGLSVSFLSFWAFLSPPADIFSSFESFIDIKAVSDAVRKAFMTISITGTKAYIYKSINNSLKSIKNSPYLKSSICAFIALTIHSLHYITFVHTSRAQISSVKIAVKIAEFCCNL